jgi:hypothetical protein
VRNGSACFRKVECRSEVLDFVFAHQQCADMLIDLGPDTESGYRLLLTCGCGSEFKRWVRADGDGLRFVLLAFEN